MSSTTGNGPLPSRGLVMPAAFSAMHARRIRDRQQSPLVSSMRQDFRQRDPPPDAFQQIAPAPMQDVAPSQLQSLASWQDRRRRHRKSASSGQIGIAFSSPAEARALHDRPLTAEETDSMLDSVLDLYHETGEESEEEALAMLRQQQRQQAQCEAELQRLSLPETLKDEVLTNSSTRSIPAIGVHAATSEEDASKIPQVGQATQIQPQPSTVPCRRDRYGFRCTSVHISAEAYDAWSSRYEEHLVRRCAKWDALLSEMPSPANNGHADQEADALVFPPRSAKLQRYIRKGIPPEYRGRAWFHYAEGPARLKAHPGLYARLVTQAAAKVGDLNNDLIERDLHRTFPDNVHFKPEGYVRSAHSAAGGGVGQGDQDKHAEPPMIHALRRVLQAFALYRPQVGYCQSLNFIAALFLLFLPEEYAFWMLVIMTTEYLPHVHDANLEGANVDQAVLMLAVRESLPAVWSKLGTGFETPTPGAAEGRSGTTFASRRPSLGKLSTASSSASGSIKAGNKASPHEIIQTLPPITLVTAAWFMSAFIGSLPIETTLRVWDCLFYEGSKVLFRIALTMLKLGERRLLHVTDPMEIFQTVQALPHSHLDAGVLMEACFKRRNGVGHLSQKEVDARRGKVAAIRSRQAAAATMANASPSTTMTTVSASMTTETTSATASPAELASGQEGGHGFAEGAVRVSQDKLAVRVPPVGPVRKASGRSLHARLLVRKTT